MPFDLEITVCLGLRAVARDVRTHALERQRYLDKGEDTVIDLIDLFDIYQGGKIGQIDALQAETTG